MKNIRQTKHFQAWQLMRKPMDGIQKAAEALNNGTPEAEVKSELLKTLTPEQVGDMEVLGASSPLDMVGLEMSVGSLVFDIVRLLAVAPTAPLAKMNHDKMISDLADMCQKDEFTLTPLAKELCHRALTEEDTWRSIQVGALIERKDMDRQQWPYMTITSAGAASFTEVMNALIVELQ